VPRAVLDPSVLVSALISPSGPSARLLVELRAGAFELVTSPLLLAELGEVLLREKFRRYVSEDEAAAYAEFLRAEGLRTADPEPPAVPLSEDPDDEYLITLARATRVDALVSGDQHLLTLRQAIPVTSPREFLEPLLAKEAD
jgi:putative PIN family toxin of toxin-antitoxin system